MENRKTAAIILSGCGVYDGSEIHEAVITLLNLQRRNVRTRFFAPDIAQNGTVNHLDGTPQETRGVLAESARIARGDIAPLSEFSADDFDMLLFPGGFGAAKNLSDFAAKGAEMSVIPQVDSAVKSMLKAGKPLGFLCIAPVIAAKSIGCGVKLTIGNDAQTAAAIEKLGAKHVECPADGFVADKERNVFSTPAYMLANSTVAIDTGVGAMIDSMLESVK